VRVSETVRVRVRESERKRKRERKRDERDSPSDGKSGWLNMSETVRERVRVPTV